MVMGGDSWSESCGFESQHCILDGHFFTLISCKNCNVCLKKTENKQKEAVDAHFYKSIFQNYVKNRNKLLQTFIFNIGESEVIEGLDLVVRDQYYKPF